MRARVKFLSRLRDKLLLAIAALVLVLIGAVLYTMNARLQSVANEALYKDLSKTLTIFNRIVQERLSSLTSEAVLLSDDSHLKAALDVPSPNVATTTDVCLVLSGASKDPDRLFLVTDRKGRILYDSFHIPEVNLALREGRDPDPKKIKPLVIVNAAGWPNIQKALGGGGSRGGFIYPLPSEDKNGNPIQRAFQAVTIPIRIKEQILGTLTLGFPLDDTLAAQLKQMTDSEIAVYIGGKVYASTWAPEKRALVEKGLGAVGNLAGQGSHENGDIKTIPVVLERENYLSLFSSFKDTQNQAMGDYAILRSLDKAQALQRNLQRSIGGIGAAGILFAFVVALFIAHRITQPINSLLKGVQEVGKGNLNVQVPVETGDEVGVLAESFNGMIQGLREKERVTNILGKYISPEVARKVLADQEGILLKGERRECAVMFTDIRGFTAMSEHAEPEKIVADLNEYFTLMVDVVLKYEGTLDKFIGDAVMAVWGAPVPFEDKELRAVKAALEMQEVLATYNQARAGKKLPPITMGVGINSGMVVSGNLGSDKRTDYTVIGEEVNLASRICSKAAPGQVLISEYTYRKLKGQVEVRALEPIVLKGFTDPVKVYEVTGLKKLA
ncbi:MAG TPA: adenylate/guanylate cyclase domain-containing protein [bacterium]|nr:adenylate/guanylate cyclase domain-containing protein [bacterium]